MITEITDTTYGEELYKFDLPVTVVIDQPWEHVASDERILLGKILASIRQSQASVRILQASNLNPANFPPRALVISFGVNAGTEIIPYQLTILNEVSFVISDTLDNLDDTKKKNLWAALRAMSSQK